LPRVGAKIPEYPAVLHPAGKSPTLLHYSGYHLNATSNLNLCVRAADVGSRLPAFKPESEIHPLPHEACGYCRMSTGSSMQQRATPVRAS
jgi:hypothetical protein